MLADPKTLKLGSVRIDNFRAIAHATIPLHPQLTVLIGENATGKTTILEAIATALWPLVRKFTSSSRPGINVTEFDFRGEAGTEHLGEPFRATSLGVHLESTIGPIGSHYRLNQEFADHVVVRGDHERRSAEWISRVLERGETAPVLAYYRDNRGQFHGGREPMGRRHSQGRQAAYLLAFGARVYFDEAVAWFEEMENAELRDQREHGPEFRDPRLSAVRKAVEKLVPEVSDLRMLGRPPRLAMTLHAEGQDSQVLAASQLSSGFRTMVALAMDLARRMADLNPHLTDPTASSGVVLIDEVDLHLHPRWQQLVVRGLLDAFPNVQFVMSTHSPQVLTTLRQENVLKLEWVDGGLTLESVPSPEGAEAGRMLTLGMGVDERPPAAVSDFVAALETYVGLLRGGKADAKEALKALQEMRELSPDDPVLATLDLEKRRLAARRD